MRLWIVIDAQIYCLIMMVVIEVSAVAAAADQENNRVHHRRLIYGLFFEIIFGCRLEF